MKKNQKLNKSKEETKKELELGATNDKLQEIEDDDLEKVTGGSALKPRWVEVD